MPLKTSALPKDVLLPSNGTQDQRLLWQLTLGLRETDQAIKAARHITAESRDLLKRLEKQADTKVS